VGHGIQSAAAMGKLASATRALALVSTEPAQLLAKLDVIATADEAMRFASMALVLADLQAGVLTISLAGHPAPLVRSSSSEVLELNRARSTSLGGLPVQRTQESLNFEGTIDLVLYTDGLTERRDQHPSETIDNMREALRIGPSPANSLSDFLLSRMKAGEQGDDVALLCAKIIKGPKDFEQVFASTLRCLAPLRKKLREWTEIVGMSELEREDVILAVGEAATNAIEHGNRSDPSRHVTVAVTLQNDQLKVVVADEGQWTPPEIGNGLRGRGLGLMKASMDAVLVEPTPAGTVLTLLKRLQDPGTIADLGRTNTKVPV
jgi:anti-sigma regulatory factor (Ser/Thr protein kinase)